MFGPPQPAPPVSPELFFVWDNQREDRHEYIHGQILRHQDDTLGHNLICSNLQMMFRPLSRPGGSSIIRNLKLRIDTNYCYPDLMLHPRPADLRGWNAQYVEHPVLIAEVLSPSTAHYDEHTKWPLYQRIPTLQTFLLVAQDQPMVHHYRRHGAAWLYTCHTTLDDLLELAEPALTLPLRELYAGIDGVDPAVPPPSA